MAKQVRKRRKPVGLGDQVEKATKATGIKKVVEMFTPDGKDCGCDKRKEQLNNFPIKFNCMNKKQYDDWTDFKERNPKELNQEDQELIVSLLKEVRGMSVEPCSNCGAAIWKGWIDKIDQVYNTYQ